MACFLERKRLLHILQECHVTTVQHLCLLYHHPSVQGDVGPCSLHRMEQCLPIACAYLPVTLNHLWACNTKYDAKCPVKRCQGAKWKLVVLLFYCDIVTFIDFSSFFFFNIFQRVESEDVKAADTEASSCFWGLLCLLCIIPWGGCPQPVSSFAVGQFMYIAGGFLKITYCIRCEFW